MEVPAAPPNVIPSQTMLVPPVLNGRHVSRENQQKRWQGTKLVNLVTLLDLYPPLYPAHVPHSPPLHQIYHHHSRVEVTGLRPANATKNLRSDQNAAVKYLQKFAWQYSGAPIIEPPKLVVHNLSISSTTTRSESKWRSWMGVEMPVPAEVEVFDGGGDDGDGDGVSADADADGGGEQFSMDDLDDIVASCDGKKSPDPDSLGKSASSEKFRQLLDGVLVLNGLA
ncbi:hypothetical protein RIF29_11344 [Crotalaria pallida]|uniref:Uncharacterized protein n=1 Tax=Crotalaria pallida TaxID=3830 RepID=A0AAN9IM12_CROPI